MCGIAGIIESNKKVDTTVLKNMMESMKHRGPDDEGMHIEDNIGLGHKRLSIIDLEMGHQPLSNEDESLWILYNGEIYNYLEVRNILKNKHTFKTRSDTEVIIHAYEEWGKRCVEKLNGMFAFAILDTKSKELFCARDRLGIKPFYYFQGPDVFIFASEIKAILCDGRVAAKPNYSSILDYLMFTFVLGDKTFFENIKKLMPGHTLTLKNGNMTIEEYWDLNYDSRQDSKDANYLAELRRKLEEAVRLQLRSDVPVGCYLSGGIDSSIVTTLASSLSEKQISNFTGKFAEGPEYDESPYAKDVSAKANTNYKEISPSHKTFLKLLPKLIWHLDEPVVSWGIFPQYYVSELASKHVKVVLGGQGGDEVFAGYPKYDFFFVERSLLDLFRIKKKQKNVDTRTIARELFGILREGEHIRGYVLGNLLRRLYLFNRTDCSLFEHIKKQSDTTLSNYLHPNFKTLVKNYSPIKEFEMVYKKCNANDFMNLAQYIDLKTYLTGLLQVEDRISMAVSLESRVPLLDHTLVEYSCKIPVNPKVYEHKMKYAFREAVKDILPESVLTRTDKKGFPTPAKKWLYNELRKDVLDILTDERTIKRGIFDIDKATYEFQKGKLSPLILWEIICIELWFRIFIDKTMDINNLMK